MKVFKHKKTGVLLKVEYPFTGENWELIEETEATEATEKPKKKRTRVE